MMKKLILILTVLIATEGYSQIYQQPTLFGKEETRLDVLQLLGIPADTIPPIAAKKNKPHVASKNGVLYMWNVAFQKFMPATGDTTNNNYPTTLGYSSDVLTLGRNGLSNLTATIPLSTKLNTGDTAAMLAPYLRSKDTTWLHNRLINHTHVIGDITGFTAGVRNAISSGSGISYNPETGVIAATAATTYSAGWGLTEASGVFKGDTSLLVTKNALRDTAANIRAMIGAGAGSVTSVNASVSGALGVTGGPITNSGTLAFAWQGTSSQQVLGDGSLAAKITNNNQLTNGAGYVDQAGARAALSLTTTGSGASTYNSTTGVLNIPNYTYTLPTASTSTLGGVKVDGSTITIDGSGVISAAAGSAHGVSVLKNYVTQTTSTGSGTTNDITIVNIPANTLANDGDGIEMEVAFTTTGTDTKTINVDIGSSSTLVATSDATTAGIYVHKIRLYRTSSTAAIFRSESVRGLNQQGVAQIINNSFNWSASQDLKVHLTSTTAASITINYVTVKIVKE